MAGDSNPARNNAQSFLAEGEEPQLQWQGMLVESEEEEYPAQFAATDSRLIFSLGGGHFKDISFKDIESVEVGTDIETEQDGIDPDGLFVIGGVSVVAGIGAMVVGGFSAISVLAALILVGLGGYAVVYAKENYDQLKEDLEVYEYEIYHIILRTSATSPFSMPIYIQTDQNVGPTLSKLVQESK